MGNYKLIIGVFIASALLLGLLGYWYDQQTNGTPELRLGESDINGPLTAEEQDIVKPTITNTMNPHAIFKTSHGDIELELFADQMPITVGNFMALAESGFYDNTKFHRVIEGFMIQGGDPNTKGENEAIYGTGGPEENIPDEFVAGEFLTNTRGTIAMANTGQPNSGGSQWFINLVDNTGLDFDKPPLTSKHPVFGRVVNGMDVVDGIGTTETKERDIPVEPVVIETITIVEN
ncbi:MAG: peptidylprolyl isomerase [Candidatus Paceibacterota bacterium]